MTDVAKAEYVKGRASRDAEVAEWRKQMLREVARYKVEETKVARLQEQLDAADKVRAFHQQDVDTLVEQRDAAWAQRDALAEIFKRVLPEPYHCHECQTYFNAVDEDECCVSCGAQSQTLSFDDAIAAVKDHE